MYMLPKNLKFSWRGKLKKGLKVEEIDNLLGDVEKSFFDGTEYPPGVLISETVSIFDVIKGINSFPLSSHGPRYESEAKFYGVDLGKVEITGLREQATIYGVLEVMADLNKVPRNNEECNDLENRIREGISDVGDYMERFSLERFRDAKLRIAESGIIIGRYIKIKKEKVGGGVSYMLTEENHPPKGGLQIRKIHLIVPYPENMTNNGYLDSVEKSTIDRLFFSGKHIKEVTERTGKPFPEKIMRGIHDYMEHFGVMGKGLEIPFGRYIHKEVKLNPKEEVHSE